ncbi:uncharacterized protein LOC123038082 [Drosophila rhopaloa]|uniref:DUF6570 domain-containing protein n=1 Tax=Drosophila rhopaloa TaxID=1041015 RepID=A0ABM5JFI5_DRORH|nr:uncharacterized protein LOC123038082 [Drosophila rhopaloa]
MNVGNSFYLSRKFPSPSGIYLFCSTCRQAVSKGRLPSLCLSNGLDFPEIPECLKNLTCLEERLISPRIPFMRIISLGYERQCGIRGAVVNVPISVPDTVSALPRSFNSTHVIQVHLKRKLEYSHNFMTETIRPARVLEAVRYLVNTELYRKHNIIFDNDWLNQVGDREELPFIADESDREEVEQLLRQQLYSQQIDQQEEELNPGGHETLLENNNTELERIALAPGEGRRPTNLTLDEDAEELSFPTISCGEIFKANVTYAKKARSQIRFYDRRCAVVPKVLYMYKFYEMQRIQNTISIALRKKSGAVTAANIRDESFVDRLVQHDDGYHILKGLRSAPAHWEAEKKKLLP